VVYLSSLLLVISKVFKTFSDWKACMLCCDSEAERWINKELTKLPQLPQVSFDNVVTACYFQSGFLIVNNPALYRFWRSLKVREFNVEIEQFRQLLSV